MVASSNVQLVRINMTSHPKRSEVHAATVWRGARTENGKEERPTLAARPLYILLSVLANATQARTAETVKLPGHPSSDMPRVK